MTEDWCCGALLCLPPIHSCIISSSFSLLQTGTRGTEYSLNLSNVLIRTRFGRMLTHAHALWQEEGAAIIEEILWHGRLNKTEIVGRVTKRLGTIHTPLAPSEKTIGAKVWEEKLI